MLLVLAACFLPADPTQWQLCQARWEVACECEDPMLTGNSGDGSPDWACHQDVDEQCAEVDPDLCDPKSAKFDAEGCEQLHQWEENPSEYESLEQCQLRALQHGCDRDAYAACGEAWEASHP